MKQNGESGGGGRRRTATEDHLTINLARWPDDGQRRGKWEIGRLQQWRGGGGGGGRSGSNNGREKKQSERAEYGRWFVRIRPSSSEEGRSKTAAGKELAQLCV